MTFYPLLAVAAFLLLLFVIYSFFWSGFYQQNLYWIITNNNCSIKSAIKLCVHGFRYHLKLGVGAQLLPADKVITQRDLCKGLTCLYALTGIGLVSLLVVQLFEHTLNLGTHCWYPLNCSNLKHCCDLSDQCAFLPSTSLRVLECSKRHCRPLFTVNGKVPKSCTERFGREILAATQPQHIDHKLNWATLATQLRQTKTHFPRSALHQIGSIIEVRKGGKGRGAICVAWLAARTALNAEWKSRLLLCLDSAAGAKRNQCRILVN